MSGLRMRRRGQWPRIAVLLGALILTGSLAKVLPAMASNATDADAAYCLSHATGSLSFTSTTVLAGLNTTVTWQSSLPQQCYTASLNLHLRNDKGDELLDPPIPMAGRRSSFPMAVPQTGTWSLELTATETTGTVSQVIGPKTKVTVNEPDPLEAGSHVTISNGGTTDRAKFIQAMVTPDAVVTVAGGVNLDLSGVADIPVAPGVQLIGDRTVNPVGPRLFTTTFTDTIFVIANDGVRITGIRLDGGESDTVTTYAGLGFDEDAIQVFSSQHIEIDHNEIFKWHGAAVHVLDKNQDRLTVNNPDAVRVHDNFIHDNQHPTASGLERSAHGAGYGVELSDGGYAKIEHNVFNNNRHAITGDGKAGTGYFAYGNLFLHPGIDRTVAGSTHYNHQIDMHGLSTCGQILGFGESYNCGPAGEYMDVAYNTVVSTDSDAIQLRGVPSIGMSVEKNVFAQTYDHALTQTVNGIVDNGGNVYQATWFNNTGKSCDFDGDGIADSFRTSGETWWYQSSRLGYFVYLNTSTLLGADVTLGDVDGDNRCDMTAGGTVYHNTDPVLYARQPANLSSISGSWVAFNLIAAGGKPPYRWAVTGLPPGIAANTAGLVVGRPRATAVPTYAVTATVADANGQTTTLRFTWTVQVAVPNVLGDRQSAAQDAITAAGLTVGAVKTNSDCASPGDVEVQDPWAAAAVPYGSAVSITVSQCPPPPPPGGGGDGPGPILDK